MVCPPDALRRYAGCAAGDHLVASVFYKDYASLFRNNKSIVKMVTPANYVSAMVKYSKMRWFAGDQTLVRIGEDAHKGALISGQRKNRTGCSGGRSLPRRKLLVKWLPA